MKNKKVGFNLMNPFLEVKASKFDIVIPAVDCITMHMMYKRKAYGGWVKVNFEDQSSIDKVFQFLVKTGNNQIRKLKEKQCLD